MQPERHDIELSVNGTIYRRAVESRTLLSDFLRHDLELAGTHVGCEHGVCGACTILLDGAPIRSCLMLAVQANGHELSTVEGLAGNDGELHPVQQAMHDHHGLQMRLLHARHFDDDDGLPEAKPAAFGTRVA